MVIIAMAATPILSGPVLAGRAIASGITPTITAVGLVLAAVVTVLFRMRDDLPVVPARLFKEPAVIATIIYFVIGVATFFVVTNRPAYYKEIVQRTVLIWVPFYACCFGLRKVEHLQKVLLWYLPLPTLLSLVSMLSALSSKFETPVYLLGLHKNQLSGLCATAAIISLSHLFTSKRPTITLFNRQLPNKLTFLSITAINLLGIIATQGRGALLEVAVGGFMIMVAVKTKKSTLIKLAVAGLLLSVIAYKLLPEKAAEHVTGVEEHSANYERIVMWTDAWDRFVQNPFSMTGWGNGFYDDNGNYNYDMISLFFFDLMQMSIVGAVALLVMIALSIKVGIDNAQVIRNNNSPIAFINAAALAIVAAKFAHGMVDCFWVARGHTFHVWIGVGMMFFVKLWLDQQGQSRSQPVRRTRKAAVAARV
jgi:hypothetical protein